MCVCVCVAVVDNEPEDLSYLAPTAGDGSIPLGFPSFLQGKVASFIAAIVIFKRSSVCFRDSYDEKCLHKLSPFLYSALCLFKQ